MFFESVCKVYDGIPTYQYSLTKMYNYFESVCVDAGKGDQARLIRDLLQGCDRDAKPVKNASDPVTVKLTVTYNQLQDLVSI